MEKSSYIRRYAKPLWGFLSQDDVLEVAVNPNESVWVERRGDHSMMPTDVTMDANAIAQLTAQIAGAQGSRSGRENLLTSAMLQTDVGQVRVQCVLPPASEGAGSITIRKFSVNRIPASSINIIRQGREHDVSNAIEEIRKIWDSEDPSFDRIADIIVEAHLTVLVSGGTGSGKTTILKAILAKIPSTERIITIEDVQEILPSQPNYVGLLADRDSDVRGPKELLASVLRMRPDRFLMGELRGDEARMFLEAINTGHEGSMSTMHANSAEKAINRLVLMALGGAGNLTPSLIVSNICDTVDIVLQAGRSGPNRGLIGLYVPSEHAKELRTKF